MAKLTHNDFSLTVPDDWQDASQLVAIGPVDHGFRPNIVVTRDGPTKSIEAYAAQQQLKLKAVMTALTVVREGPAKVGKHQGFLREYTFTSNNQALRQIQFYLAAPNATYVLTFTHLASKLVQTFRPSPLALTTP